MCRAAAHALILGILIVLLRSEVCGGPALRYLVLNFDCRGKAAGKAEAIGDELRKQVIKEGGLTVSRNLFEKLMKQKNWQESDLNYTIEDLRSILHSVGADGAAFGIIYTYEDMFTIEMKYLEPGAERPVLFDPIVCGSIDDILETIPHMAAMILSPDKVPPTVLSVDPPDGCADVGQIVDLRIVFSEPMNPATISVSALPADMWSRFGDIGYDLKTNCFNLKLHLYPEMEYEFQVNGDDSKGFKDLAGNPASKYTWRFKTSR